MDTKVFMGGLEVTRGEHGETWISRPGKGTMVCYRGVSSSSSGIFLGQDPFNFCLPLLLFQICVIFAATRLTHSILRHLSQPAVVSQIIAGIILGPSFLSRNKTFHRLMFAEQSRQPLETLSNLAFVIFLFMLGVKTDLAMIPKSGKKAFAVAIIGTILPLSTSLVINRVFQSSMPPAYRQKMFILTVTSRWSLTSYAVLSSVLDELNLLTSKLGRLAMSASLIADFVNTFAAAVFTAYVLGITAGELLMGIESFASYVVFMLCLVFLARPLGLWIIRKAPEGGLLDEAGFMAIVLMAIACSFISELIGFHASMGPFVLGLLLPGGPPLGVTLVERMDRLVLGVLLPIYLAYFGMKMQVSSLVEVSNWRTMETFILICVVGKFVGVMLPCLYCKMPFRDALALGLMMNSKGIAEVEALNQWQDSQLMDAPMFGIVVASIVVLGGSTAPLVKYLYRPEDRFIAYKRRTVQHSKHTDELRVLACIHSQEHVGPVISLIDASCPTKDSPVCVYVLHLVQLVGRTAAILLPYKKPSLSSSSPVSESDRIVNAFRHLEQQYAGAVSVLPYVGISPHVTMHDDVCSLALDKKAALIIVPFHRHLDISGALSTANPAIQAVNVNVLRYAPCSVGILVDHGMQHHGNVAAGGRLLQRVAVYFLGGPDDWEALAYGARMAENPDIGLTVVRFRLEADWKGCVKEEKLDEEIVDEFRRTSVDGRRVVYREEVVRDGEGTVAVIRAISGGFSLLIVGRHDGKETPLTEGLSVWSEYLELGVIGDLLASADFGAKVSTLVVQQQARVAGGGLADSPRNWHPGNQVVPHDDDGA